MYQYVPLIVIDDTFYRMLHIDHSRWGVWYCHRTPVYSQIRERKNIHLSHELSVVLCPQKYYKGNFCASCLEMSNITSSLPHRICNSCWFGVTAFNFKYTELADNYVRTFDSNDQLFGAQRISYWNVNLLLDKVRLLVRMPWHADRCIPRDANPAL